MTMCFVAETQTRARCFQQISVGGSAEAGGGNSPVDPYLAFYALPIGNPSASWSGVPAPKVGPAARVQRRCAEWPSTLVRGPLSSGASCRCDIASFLPVFSRCQLDNL